MTDTRPLQPGSRTPPSSELDDTARDEKTGKVAAPAGIEESVHPALSAGSHIGRYVVLEKLGEGGMGVVYAAWDPELNRKVALKLLHAQSPGSGSGGQKSNGHQQRLLREAQALAQLAHPNVVGVHDVGTFRDAVFIAMEFVEGQNLRAWFKAAPRPWKEVLHVFKDAGKGLAAAHAKGLVHRDFKPDNVLLSAEGRVYVLDFGLARAEGQGLQTDEQLPSVTDSGRLLAAPLTQAGAVLGTKPYMAQELLEGAPADARSDLYAFAVSLYEALYGERPFPSAGPRVLREAPEGRQVPPWLRRIVLKGLSAAPEDRPSSMRELLEELEQDPAPKRRQLFLALGIASAVVAAGLGLHQLEKAQSQLCQGEGEKLAGVWDTSMKAVLERAFLATGDAEGPRMWTRTSAVLSAYAENLVAARTQACVDTRVKGTQTDEVFSLKMACLDRRLTDLRALTGVLAQSKELKVRKALDAANNLTPLEACDNLQALRDPVRLPEDPHIRAKVEELTPLLARAKALRLTGDNQGSLELSEPLIEKAHEVGYLPLEAELIYEVGRNQFEFDKPQTGETLRKAVLVALAGKHHEVVAVASTRLVWEASKTGNFGDASFWAEHALAALRALDGNPLMEADVYSALSAATSNEKPWSRDALELDLRSHELRMKVLGPDNPRMGYSYNNLGIDYSNFREFEPALQNYKKALELMLEEYGPDHPFVAYPLSNIAELMLIERGPSKEAEDYQVRALRLREEKLGADSALTASARMHLGRHYFQRGEYKRSVEVLQRGIDDMTKDSSKDLELTTFQLTLARALRAQGRPAAALELFKKTSVLAHEIREKDDPEVWDLHAEIALTLVRLGRRAEAVAELGKAQGYWNGLEPDSFRYADGQRQLAAWSLVDGKPEVALSHDERALQIYEKRLGPAHRDVGDILLRMGKAQLALGKPAEARASLERAVQILASAQVAPELQGEAGFALAQAVVLEGRDAARGRELARRATEDFERSEAGDKLQSLQKIRTWLDGRF